MKTIAKYGNSFQNNRPVIINSMFNECSAVHLHSNALQVIRVPPHEFLTRFPCCLYLFCAFVCLDTCTIRMCITPLYCVYYTTVLCVLHHCTVLFSSSISFNANFFVLCIYESSTAYILISYDYPITTNLLQVNILYLFQNNIPLQLHHCTVCALHHCTVCALHHCTVCALHHCTVCITSLYCVYYTTVLCVYYTTVTANSVCLQCTLYCGSCLFVPKRSLSNISS